MSVLNDRFGIPALQGQLQDRGRFRARSRKGDKGVDQTASEQRE